MNTISVDVIKYRHGATWLLTSPHKEVPSDNESRLVSPKMLSMKRASIGTLTWSNVGVVESMTFI